MNGYDLSSILSWFFIFLFGSLWGSFFYTLALRFSHPFYRDNLMKTLFHASRCPRCGVKISFLGLMPFLGYLLYNGRCNQCGKRISPLYPFTELLFGILSCVLVYTRGITLAALLMFLILGLAAAISIIDIKTLLIPNPLVLALLALSLLYIAGAESVVTHFIGAAGMFAFFVIILLLFPGSFGGGDVKYASVIGLLMGAEYSIVVMEIALITGSITGIAYVFLTRNTFRAKIPFAPFLSIGLLGAVLYGREFIFFYNSMIYW